MSRRVVITGVGAVTAFGVGMDPLWAALTDGRSAVRRITRFDPCPFPCKVAAELDEDAFRIRDYVPRSHRKAAKVMCRDIELAVAAAHAAVLDAGLVTRGIDPDATPTIAPERLGCHVGAGLIASDVDELAAALWCSRAEDGTFDLAHWGETGMQNLTPLWLLKYLPNMLACHVTIVHDCQGPSNTITCCESSGALSLGESLRVVERGAADACLTGGAEYKLNLMAFYRQLSAGRLAPSDGAGDAETTGLVRPFAPDATGTVLGEGGGILVLEAAESAEARGATARAAVAGFAATQSRCPDTIGLQIEPDGRGIADAIVLALEQAGLAADDVDAVVPFGSGIPHLDRAEAAALETALGARAASVPLVTVIPNVGNCCAGAGAVALGVATRCLETQSLPARLNTRGAAGLDADACDARPASLEHVLVVSTGQGGQNAAIVLERAA